jgi:NAD(P)-dependent dehydrogenase (short-subunit alcohol dehydrogenase family)
MQSRHSLSARSNELMASLNGRVGIVTGGGTGIGKATALAMTRAGAAVVIGNRDAAKGEEVVAPSGRPGAGPCSRRRT